MPVSLKLTESQYFQFYVIYYIILLRWRKALLLLILKFLWGRRAIIQLLYEYLMFKIIVHRNANNPNCAMSHIIYVIGKLLPWLNVVIWIRIKLLRWHGVVIRGQFRWYMRQSGFLRKLIVTIYCRVNDFSFIISSRRKARIQILILIL